MKIVRGKYVLTHERIVDEMGFEQDNFDLLDIKKRIHMPFFGKMKVSNKDMNFPINKIPYQYTQEDYNEMLTEQITNYENIPQQ